jgi:hypothetical protein
MMEELKQLRVIVDELAGQITKLETLIRVKISAGEDASQERAELVRARTQYNKWNEALRAEGV